MLTTEDKANNDAATQMMGNVADNDNAAAEVDAAKKTTSPMQCRQRTTMQTTDNDADDNAAIQTTGDDADNDNVLQCRQGGDVTTSRKRVVVMLVRARAVAVALATAVAVVAARSLVVVVTVMVTVAAARLVVVDLYVSGRILLEKTICKAWLTLLRRRHRKQEFIYNSMKYFSAIMAKCHEQLHHSMVRSADQTTVYAALLCWGG
jgi:hypothetical protein